jgi:hypothetical protein
MEKKFCQSCQMMKPIEEVKLVKTVHNKRRWKCLSCIGKTSTKVYSSEKK